MIRKFLVMIAALSIITVRAEPGRAAVPAGRQGSQAYRALVFDAQNGLSGYNITSLHYDGKYMYIGYESGKVDRYNYLFERFDRTYSFPKPVRKISSDEDYVWIGLSEGLKRINRLTEEIDPSLGFTELAGKSVYDLDINNEYVLAVCGESNIAASAGGFYLGRLRRGQAEFTQFGAREGLMFEDIFQGVQHNRDFYLASSGGLIAYHDNERNFRLYSAADGFPEYRLFAIERDKGQLHIGGAGVYYEFSIKDRKTVKSVALGGSDNEYINNLEILDDKIYLGTNGSGLFCFDRGKNQWYRFDTGEYCYEYVISLAKDADSLWVVSRRSDRAVLTRIVPDDFKLPADRHLLYESAFRYSIDEPFAEKQDLQGIFDMLAESVQAETILDNLVRLVKDRNNIELLNLFTEVLWIDNKMIHAKEFINTYLSAPPAGAIPAGPGAIKNIFIQDKKYWGANYRSGNITYFSLDDKPLLEIELFSRDAVSDNIRRDVTGLIRFNSMTLQGRVISRLQ